MSYYLRVRNKAWEETALFAKKRLLFACCMGVIVLSANWYFGTAHLTAVDLVRNLLIFVVSYAFVWGVAFGINVVRAPGLLDRESAAETFTLRERVQSKAAIETVRTRFAALMNEGADLADTLRKGLKEFQYWLIQRADWIKRTSQALEDVGYPTEASAFRQATEYTPDFKGVADSAFWHKFYGAQLEHSRSKL